MIYIGYIHIPWVMEAQGLTPTEKIVLACLTWHANNETRKTWVAMGTIATECGYSEGSRRTVRRTLQALRSKGFISYQDQGSGQGKQQKSNTYTVNWNRIPDPKEGGQETPGSGDPRVNKPRVGGQETPGGGSHSPTNRELNREPNRECFTSEQSPEQKASPATLKNSPHRNAAANDPISETFYSSDDRQALVQNVRDYATLVADEADTTAQREALDLLEQNLNLTFPGADLSERTTSHAEWIPPTTCVRKPNAAKWLNQFLHSLKTEIGELTWRGNQ